MFNWLKTATLLHAGLAILLAVGFFRFWIRTRFWLPRYVHWMAAIALCIGVGLLPAIPEDAPINRGGATLLLLGGLAAPAPPEDFTGTWEVTKIVEGKTGEFQWSLEIEYPTHMTLEIRNGHLAGRYTDQWGYSGEFELVSVINQGHDLLLVNGGAGTKNPESYSPIHHVKLVKGKLHAIVTSHDKLFEWVAERR